MPGNFPLIEPEGLQQADLLAFRGNQTRQYGIDEHCGHDQKDGRNDGGNGG